MKFSLGALLTVIGFFAFVFASRATFGDMGVGPACAVVVLAWRAISRTNLRTLYPLSCRMMTTGELIVLLAICFLLTLIALPAVNSGGHRRKRSTQPVVQPSVQPAPVSPPLNGNPIQ